jgi:hypothetical protein
MVRMHADRPFGDEEYVRAGGVLIPVNNGHEVGHADEKPGPFGLLADLIADEGVGSTPDDLPYDYGVEVALPADQMLPNLERRTEGR